MNRAIAAYTTINNILHSNSFTLSLYNIMVYKYAKYNAIYKYEPK